MGLLERLFKKSQSSANKKPQVATVEAVEQDEWTPIQGYVPADKEDFEKISVIASAIAAGDYPDSQFKITRILKRSEEARIISIISAAIAASELDDSHWRVKNIYEKKN